MKPIPNNFRKNSWDYKLIKRVGDVVIYAQSKKGIIKAYETHKIRQKTASTCEFHGSVGKVITVNHPNREILAGNEDFGRYGWTFFTLEKAQEKLQELTKGV